MNPFQNAARQMDAPRMERRGYAGAQQNRLTRDWFAPSISPDREAGVIRPLLRARARQLVQDNSYAAGFVSAVQNNVIGPTGIKLRAMIQTRVGDAHDKTNAAIEEGWKEWGYPENASADGHDSWLDMEKLIIRTIAMDGECFIRHRKYFDNDFGYALQIIDCDQVDDYWNRAPDTMGNEIRGGIELDNNSRPVNYHIWSRHPSDVAGRKREIVPADEIVHLFVRTRPNQTRGVTWFAPVLTNLKIHDGYTEAELVAARIGAAKMGFYVTKADGMGIGPDINTPEDENERIMEASPGTFDELPPGMEVQTFDPQHPNAGFKDFTKSILRGVARGLGISYTALTGDLEGVNYSSIRWGMLDERDYWRTLQNWLSIQCHRRIYNNWVGMALLSGALSVDSRIASNYKAIEWKGRGWGWVDPLKDIQARILGIQHGLDDRTTVLDEEGEDVQSTFQNLKNEKDLAEEMGIDITPIAAPMPNRPMGQPSQADKEETDPNNPDNADNKAAEAEQRQTLALLADDSKEPFRKVMNL